MPRMMLIVSDATLAVLNVKVAPSKQPFALPSRRPLLPESQPWKLHLHNKVTHHSNVSHTPLLCPQKPIKNVILKCPHPYFSRLSLSPSLSLSSYGGGALVAIKGCCSLLSPSHSSSSA